MTLPEESVTFRESAGREGGLGFGTSRQASQTEWAQGRTLAALMPRQGQGSTRAGHGCSSRTAQVHGPAGRAGI